MSVLRTGAFVCALLLAACARDEAPAPGAQPSPERPLPAAALPAVVTDAAPAAASPAPRLSTPGRDEATLWSTADADDPVERWAELAGANLGHAQGCDAPDDAIARYRQRIDAERGDLAERGLDVSRFDAVLEARAQRARDDVRRLGQRDGDVQGACKAILDRLHARLAAR